MRKTQSCNMCYTDQTAAMKSKCGHVICFSCMKKWHEHRNDINGIPICPICELEMSAVIIEVESNLEVDEKHSDIEIKKIEIEDETQLSDVRLDVDFCLIEENIRQAEGNLEVDKISKIYAIDSNIVGLINLVLMAG